MKTEDERMPNECKIQVISCKTAGMGCTMLAVVFSEQALQTGQGNK